MTDEADVERGRRIARHYPLHRVLRESLAHEIAYAIEDARETGDAQVTHADATKPDPYGHKRRTQHREETRHMPSPTQNAIGTPVTLHMRDGRQLHGTLTATKDGVYTITQSTGPRDIPIRDVDTLRLREQLS